MNTPEETNSIVTEMYKPTVKDTEWLMREINEVLDGFFYKCLPDVAEFYEAGLREEIGGLIEEMEEAEESSVDEWRKEMKYKAGDKVRVREDLVDGKEYGDDSFVDEMGPLRGEVVEIERVRPAGYSIKEDDGEWGWTDEMFEGLANNAEQDPIQPDHYRKGEIDLYESWYRTRPFNEFRAIMESIAERYIKRDKENRVIDLEKAIETLTRLKEYEEMEK